MNIIEELNKLETILREHNVYIISSIDGNGTHVGEFEGFAFDTDGDLIIVTDIDSMSCTGQKQHSIKR